MTRWNSDGECGDDNDFAYVCEGCVIVDVFRAKG